jgi:hypothetical protein
VGCPCSSKIAELGTDSAGARAAPVSIVALANISGFSRPSLLGTSMRAGVVRLSLSSMLAT